jgi:hypothetical protein
MKNLRSWLFILLLAFDPLSAETKTLPFPSPAKARSVSSKIKLDPTDAATSIALLLLAPILIPVYANERAREAARVWR